MLAMPSDRSALGIVRRQAVIVRVRMKPKPQLHSASWGLNPQAWATRSVRPIEDLAPSTWFKL